MIVLKRVSGLSQRMFLEGVIEADEPKNVGSAEQLVAFSVVVNALPAAVLFGGPAGNFDGVGELFHQIIVWLKGLINGAFAGTDDEHLHILHGLIHDVPFDLGQSSSGCLISRFERDGWEWFLFATDDLSWGFLFTFGNGESFPEFGDFFGPFGHEFPERFLGGDGVFDGSADDHHEDALQFLLLFEEAGDTEAFVQNSPSVEVLGGFLEDCAILAVSHVSIDNRSLGQLNRDGHVAYIGVEAGREFPILFEHSFQFFVGGECDGFGFEVGEEFHCFILGVVVCDNSQAGVLVVYQNSNESSLRWESQ